MTTSPHEILGLPEGASTQEVKARYQKLAKRYHPDANSGDLTAEWVFKQIDKAYRNLPHNRQDNLAAKSPNRQPAPKARNSHASNGDANTYTRYDAEQDTAYQAQEAAYRRWEQARQEEQVRRKQDRRRENKWWGAAGTLLAARAAGGVAQLSGSTEPGQIIGWTVLGAVCFACTWLVCTSERNG